MVFLGVWMIPFVVAKAWTAVIHQMVDDNTKPPRDKVTHAGGATG